MLAAMLGGSRVSWGVLSQVDIFDKVFCIRNDKLFASERLGRHFFGTYTVTKSSRQTGTTKKRCQSKNLKVFRLSKATPDMFLKESGFHVSKVRPTSKEI